MSGMVKPKKINIADTNLANFGTELERNVKKASAETEPAWQNAGKQLGIQIWRIEKFKVKSWPKEQYGSFYDGDSYIVLYTYKNPGSDKIKFNVHFWLGQHTSQDEAGTAAYKTVELDTLLGDEPVQYREVQGSESNEFLKLFGRPLRIMSGGIDSGFHHVEPDKYEPKLMQIKGRRRVRALQVPLTHDSLNSGDVFVLDAGMDIYVWQGKASGLFEKNKAAELARAIDDERGGKPHTRVVNEGDNGELVQFWKILGAPAGGPHRIKTPEEGGQDDAEPPKGTVGSVKKLFRISDASGRLTFTKEAEGKIHKNMLDPSDVFVFDLGQQVFVWIGKGTTKAEKAAGLQVAADYLKREGRPAATPIARVVEGGENSQFNSFFD